MKEKQTIPAYMLLLLWVGIVCSSFSGIHNNQPATSKTIHSSKGKPGSNVVTKAVSIAVTLTEPSISFLPDKPEVFSRELYTSVSWYKGLLSGYKIYTLATVHSGFDFGILLNLLQPNAP